MHDSIILYEEEKYDVYWQRKPLKSLIVYITILLIPGILIGVDLYSMVMLRIVDYELIALAVLYVVGVIVIYWVLLRIYWAMHKAYNNPVKITTNEIEVGRLFKVRIKDLEKSVYNISEGTLYIYLKNGKRFKIPQDISKISWWGEKTHFSYIEYGKALKKIGVPFEVVRRRGFRVEPIRGREAYREMKHKERYEKWIKSRKDNKNSQTGDVRK